MGKISILDCTLRDGGYINQWKFEDKHIIDIVKSLSNSKVDIIECGYLNDKIKYNKNSTIFNSIKDIDNLLNRNNIKKLNSLFVAMVNYGDFDITNLPVKDKNSYIDGIRLAFHKEKIDEVYEISKEILAKGYKLFVQPMVTLSYNDYEILNLIDKFNKLNIYSFYIVDSFGSIDTEEFKRIFYIFDKNLNKDIQLGLHSHNNMQLAYSNAIEFLKINYSRDIIIDSCIFGMGRGAGNLNTELLINYLNRYREKSYEIIPLLEIIDNYLEALYEDNRWGFSVAHFLSAKNSCHPNYATHFINKKNLSIIAINSLLEIIDNSKRKFFDKKYAENLYLKYNIDNRNSVINFDKNIFTNKNILILASGSTVNNNKDKIFNFAKDENNLTISVNHYSKEFRDVVNYYFFSNQRRFDEFVIGNNKLDKSKIILTSNIIQIDRDIKYIVDYEELIKTTKEDNVTLLLLNLLIKYSIPKVKIAGFDGYNPNMYSDYSYQEYNRVLDKSVKEAENIRIENALKILIKSIKINFLTPSIYEKLIPIKILGVIPARYKSSRFEGKPLAKIAGIPMIKRTYLQAKKCKKLDRLVVATDDNKIYDYCISENIDVVMTSINCLTGTDRIAEVSQKLDYDLYVNIQGDEPVISPETIEQIIDEYRNYGNRYIAYNLYKEIEINDEVESDTIIKVIINENEDLIYMSRLGIPFNKSDKTPNFYKQVCVYGFTKKALDIFSSYKKTKNEQFEDIEILRFIDLNFKVKMIKTKYDSIAVDIPEDIKKVEVFLDKKI